MHPHEELPGDPVPELLAVDDVAARHVQVGRDRVHDPRPVRAGERQDVLGHQGSGRALRDQRAPFRYEFPKFHHPVEPDAAANVVGGIDRAQVRELRRLLIRQWRAARLRQSIDHRLRRAADMREHDYVVLGA